MFVGLRNSMPAGVVQMSMASSSEIPTWLLGGAVVVIVGLIVAITWRLAGRLRVIKAPGTVFEFGEEIEVGECVSE